MMSPTLYVVHKRFYASALFSDIFASTRSRIGNISKISFFVQKIRDGWWAKDYVLSGDLKTKTLYWHRNCGSTTIQLILNYLSPNI